MVTSAPKFFFAPYLPTADARGWWHSQSDVSGFALVLVQRKGGWLPSNGHGLNLLGFGPWLFLLLIMSKAQMSLILCKLSEEARRYERTMDFRNEGADCDVISLETDLRGKSRPGR
jgi:hypothetical protein